MSRWKPFGRSSGLAIAVLLAVSACGDDGAPPVEVDAGETDLARPDSGPPPDFGSCPDEDGDGSGAAPCGDDCDDADPTRFPSASEVCDDDDEDCDDTTFGADADRDGFESELCCNGAENCGNDCNDALSTVNPSAAEQCNGGVDDDCNGLADAADGRCLPCGPGLDGFDGACVDRDECAMGVCGLGSTMCMNSYGSYACVCAAGYVAPLEGGSCTDVDECAVDACGPSAAACSNTFGTYECACLPGFSAPTAGGSCTDIDECTTATDDCDTEPAASCTNTSGAFECACPARFTGAARGASGCVFPDPSLVSLTASVGVLTPVFASGTTTYALELPGAVPSVTLTPVVEFPTHATVTIDGVVVASGAASLPITLTAFAPRTISVVVLTDSGATRTYTINITGRCQVRPTGDTSWPRFRLPPGTGRVYTTSADTTIDCTTGLEWQRAVSGTSRNWANSNTYCNDLTLGGFSDWRLPTRIELMTLIDYAVAPPLIDIAAFPGTPSIELWDATQIAGAAGVGFHGLVYFDSGSTSVGGAPDSSTHRTRCVR